MKIRVVKKNYIKFYNFNIVDYSYISREFHEGLARVGKNNKYGFIDKAGKEVIKAKYDNVGEFHEGLAWFKKDGKYGFIDKTGKEVIKAEYPVASNFQDGFACVSDGRCGLIDKNGNLWTECIYGSICISDGMIILDNKYLIDLKSLQRVFTCLININGETTKKEFETEEKRDEYYKALSAYIDGRTVRKESDINEKKCEIEPLIKKLKEDILSIENNYCEDVKKEMENYYKKYEM